MANFFYEGTIASKQRPSSAVFGVPVASSTQDYAIGAKIYDDTTGAEYEYVKFSGSVAANEVMSSLDATGYTVGQCPATAAGVWARRGLSIYTATTGQYGFILVKGPGFVKYSGTGYVLGDPVAPNVAAAGKVIEHSVGATPSQAEVIRTGQVMGYALEAEDATTANLVKIFVQRS